MKAMLLRECGPAEKRPLEESEIPEPQPGSHDIVLKVSACGVCHTDLHVVEGELPPHKLPLVPGHEIVGRVVSRGERCAYHPQGAKDERGGGAGDR